MGVRGRKCELVGGNGSSREEIGIIVGNLWELLELHPVLGPNTAVMLKLNA